MPYKTTDEQKAAEFIRSIIKEKANGQKYDSQPAKFRRIIDGVTYNSDTSVIVAYYSNEEVADEWERVYESLYQTPKGHFLLVGEGQSGSIWSLYNNNAADSILAHAYVPLTADEARKWLELRDLQDEFFEIFGDPEMVGSATSEMLLRLPPVLSQRITVLAARAGMSLNAWALAQLDRAAETIGQTIQSDE